MFLQLKLYLRASQKFEEKSHILNSKNATTTKKIEELSFL
jgi:hypothetical protein